MKLPRTLVLLLAGGEGGRLRPLTEHRAKPVMPFCGQYRLIDFPLSNCVHSRLEDVWVIEQFLPQSINEHLKNGRPWDLDRTYGGLQILPPYQGKPESGWHEGNADAIWRNRRQIRDFAPDLILVLSADGVYKLDYRDVIAAHLDRHAELTMVTTRVPVEQAKRFGNVRAEGDRVREFRYKPDEPMQINGESEVTCEVFLYNAAPLMEVLDDLAQRTGLPEEEAALSDYGNDLLPEFVKRGASYRFELEGYWRDVGTIESYFDAQMQFLEEPPLRLDAPDWPILTKFPPCAPVRFADSGRASASLISPGCCIDGIVERSVLAPAVIVQRGAHIVDSILLPGVVVLPGVRVERAIIDQDVIVERDVIGGKEIEVVS